MCSTHENKETSGLRTGCVIMQTILTENENKKTHDKYLLNTIYCMYTDNLIYGCVVSIETICAELIVFYHM